MKIFTGTKLICLLICFANPIYSQQWVWDSVVPLHGLVKSVSNKANQVSIFTSRGSIISTFNANGQLASIINLSGQIQNVSFDGNNNMYVTGSFSNTITESGVTLMSRGSQDIFFAKYTPSGNLVFIKQIGSSAAENPGDVRLINGKVYVTGNAHDTTWFDQTIIPKKPYLDLFIARYDTSGSFEDVKFAQNVEQDIYSSSGGAEIKGDIFGNINVLAGIAGKIQIDTTTLYGGYSDFLLQFDSSLHLIKNKELSSSLYTWASDLNCSSSGEIIYVYHVDSHYDIEAKIQKLSADWSAIQTLYQETNGDIGQIDLDSFDNIYFTGYHEQNMFSNTQPSGRNVIAIGKLDVAENLNWLWQDSAFSYRQGSGVSVFSSGACFLNGRFRDTLVLKNTLQSANAASGFFGIFSAGNDVGVFEKEITGTKISVFPNPCHESIVISTPPRNCSVYLTNLLGEIIFRREINSGKLFTLDVRNLPSSVYILNIESEGNKMTKKVIKQ